MFGFKKKRSHSDKKPEKQIDDIDVVEQISPTSEDDVTEHTSQKAEEIPVKPKKQRKGFFGFGKKQVVDHDPLPPPTPIPAPVSKEPPKPKYIARPAVKKPVVRENRDAEISSLEHTLEFEVPAPIEEPVAESELELETIEQSDPVSKPVSEQPVDAPVTEEFTLDKADKTLLEAAGNQESSDTLAEATAEEPLDDGPATEPEIDISEAIEQEQYHQEKKGFFNRLRQGLAKTGSNLTDGMGDLVLGKRQIDDELFEELETRLLMADVGIETTTEIISSLNKRVKRKNMTDANALYDALAETMEETLAPCSVPLIVDESKQPYVILVVGVNGAGKTTTIGKLAKNFQEGGFSVMLAAGDTFRAAAVEQLTVWGERNEIPVIAQGTGADSASVVFDAFEAARARNIDILIADTAGRLHTQDNLMEELKKVKRVLGKIDEEAPHETLLVLDGGTGQNALKQGESFHEAVGVTGLAVTKLDGTAKGGVLFAMANKLGIPIRYIGVGEGIEDLRVFDAQDFVQALVTPDDNDDD